MQSGDCAHSNRKKQADEVIKKMFKNICLREITEHLKMHSLNEKKLNLFKIKLLNYQIKHADKIFDWQISLKNKKLTLERINDKVAKLPKSYLEFAQNLPQYMAYLTPSLLKRTQQDSEKGPSAELKENKNETARIRQASYQQNDLIRIFQDLIRPALIEGIKQSEETVANKELNQNISKFKNEFTKDFISTLKDLIETTDWKALSFKESSEIKSDPIRAKAPAPIAEIHQHCISALKKESNLTKAYQNIIRAYHKIT
jgi:hypothetical protein